jgi:transcriptional regulator with XRE-family HTH domain
MPRRANPSDSSLAAVRQYFGIDQQEMARYLGLSAPSVSQIEAGRQGRSAEVLRLLDPLVAALPPTATEDTPAPADLGLPERAPLEARLDYCRHHAARLRRELRPLEAQAVVAGHWRAAQPAILATLPPDPGGTEPPALPAGPARWLAYLGWYRWRWLLSRPLALPPDLSTRYHLLRLRAEALETEAAALAALLD